VVGHALAFNVVKVLVPIRFSIMYPPSDSVLCLIPAGLAAALVLALFFTREKIGRGWFVAAAAFVMLTKVSVNWFDASRLSAITDGAGYLATMPLTAAIVALAVAGIRRLKPQGPQTLVIISSTILVLIGFPAWLRSHVFDTPVAMWTDTLQTHADSYLVEASLAEQLRLRALVDTADMYKEAMDADLAAAITHARAALRLDPNNAQAQHTWASVMVAQGDDAGALEHFKAAIQSDPTNSQIREEYGAALVTLGRFKDAISQLNQSLAQDPGSSITHRLLGKAYYGLNDFDRCISEESIALSINPSDALAQEELADAQAKSGKLKEAITSYALVMRDQQTRYDLWMAIAKLKDRQGDYDLSVQYMQAAKKLTAQALEKAAADPTTTQEKARAASADKEVSDALAIELEKQRHAAATRPTTRSTTSPATTQALR
jgi:tetratricopeptide (TPR) repeat protein